MAKKKYIVRNPRGIPKGVHIISIGNQCWYEGDQFVPEGGTKVPKEGTPETLSWLLDKGFIEEVSDG